MKRKLRDAATCCFTALTEQTFQGEALAWRHSEDDPLKDDPRRGLSNYWPAAMTSFCVKLFTGHQHTALPADSQVAKQTSGPSQVVSLGLTIRGTGADHQLSGACGPQLLDY